MLKVKSSMALIAAPLSLGLGLGLLAVSCESDPPQDNPDNYNYYTGYTAHSLSDTKSFYAQNMETEAFYELDAQLMAIGNKCVVWVELDKEGNPTVDTETAKKMASVYDYTIYDMMIKSFAYEGNITVAYGGPVIARNTMELSDYLVDGDKRFTILLLDIKDGYQEPPSPGGSSYVGGYFWLGNLFARETDNAELPILQYSNAADMMYIDIYPAEPGSHDSNATLAHEMQHLMNFVNGMIERKGNTMDTWIDEGLSSAAEYLYRQAAGVTPLHGPADPSGRYYWFVSDPLGTMSKGNNFFVWGNNTGNPDSILDEYATVYMFFQWLRIQSGGTGIYKYMSTSGNTGTSVATGAFYAATNYKTHYNWDELLKKWLAANYINAPSGEYGYNNEFKNYSPAYNLNTLSAKDQESYYMWKLLPGEGVYSGINGKVMNPNDYYNTSTRKYAGLKKGGAGTVGYPPVSSDNALLSYNVDTNPNHGADDGRITGIDASVNSPVMGAMSYGSYSAESVPERMPIRIDARDMLTRNGHGEGTLLPQAGLRSLSNNMQSLRASE
jgi:hypothetical protein